MNINEVVQKFGGVRAMAKAIGKGPSAVHYWLEKGIIPSKYQPLITEALGRIWSGVEIEEGMLGGVVPEMVSQNPPAAASSATETEGKLGQFLGEGPGAAVVAAMRGAVEKASPQAPPEPPAKPPESAKPAQTTQTRTPSNQPKPAPKTKEKPGNTTPERPKCYIGSPVWSFIYGGPKPPELEAWERAGKPGIPSIPI